jgi:hypothetical protein
MPMRLSAAVIVVALLASPVRAQDNVGGGPDAREGAEATTLKSLVAVNHYFAAKYLCKDPSGTSSSVSAAVADCCIAGDIWRASIFKGNKASLLQSTANLAQFVAGATVFPPDVYSPDATLFTPVKGIQIVATIGYLGAGTMTAGGTLRVTTNGGSAVCDRKQVVNGSAAP